jgi:hypothetical protein
MRNPVFLLVLTSILLCANARADWGQGGAAYRCDTKANRFVIEATMASSADEQIVATPGFTELREKSSLISCLLKGVLVETKIEIGEPQPQGVCGAIGQVAVRNLRVKDIAVILVDQLGSPCRELRGLVRIEVRMVGRNAIVTQCSGVWDWSPKYLDTKCDESKVTM